MCFEITEEDDRFWYDKEDILRVYEMGLKRYVHPAVELQTMHRPVQSSHPTQTKSPGSASCPLTFLYAPLRACVPGAST